MMELKIVLQTTYDAMQDTVPDVPEKMMYQVKLLPKVIDNICIKNAKQTIHLWNPSFCCFRENMDATKCVICSGPLVGASQRWTHTIGPLTNGMCIITSLNSNNFQ